MKLPETWTDIEGWFTDLEAEALTSAIGGYRLGQTYVELGSYKGRSTAVLAAHARETGATFFAVDRWQQTVGVCPGLPQFGGGDIEYLSDFCRNLAALDLLRHVQPLCLMTTEAARLCADDSVDMIFHDAGHEYGAVEADLRAWLPKLRVGGIWALHDYGWAGGRAVDACPQLGTVRLEGALYIGRKIA